MDSINRHLAIKAATDAGWEMPIQPDGEWLRCASSRFQPVAWIMSYDDHSYTACFDSARLSRVLGRETATKTIAAEPANPCIVTSDNSTLYELMRRAAKIARSLPDQPCREFARKTKHLPKTTEGEQLVVRRIGQSIYRNSLLDYWDGCCAVTELAEPNLLRASHAKPWAKCDTDEERLDVFNGLLLAPHLDALFDGGWIGFADDGAIIFSIQLADSIRHTLHIHAAMYLSRVEPEHQPYLSYHRNQVMRQ